MKDDHLPDKAVHVYASDVLKPLALLAAGRTGADIERVVREARQRARREKRSILWNDLAQALRDRRFDLPDNLRWRLAVHETGHVLAAILLNVGSVETVAIGVGEGVSGHAAIRIHHPVCQDESWFTRLTACALAGRAAELLIFESALSGSGGSEGSDLAIATGHAVDAETIFGFSRIQPLVWRQTGRSFDALAFDSDLRDRVNKRLEAAMALASDIVAKHRVALVNIARQLADRYVLDGDDVTALLDVEADVEQSDSHSTTPK
jgi:ATP-dependent Zn protease